MTLFKRNIAAGYVGQIYVTLTGIVLVPTYVRYMGVEAYGLIGFYGMLQGWFMLLDMGLTPTMARETARFLGGGGDASRLRRLLRALEAIFVGIAALGATAMIVASGFIASSWLKVQQLPLKNVQHALMLIGIIVALRWVSELYRGIVTGFQRLVWLSGINVALATVRFVLVIPFFIYVGTSLMQFFSYQLVLALCETTVLVTKTYRLMPRIDEGHKPVWDWKPLRGLLHFSLAIAFAGVVWALSTQTDKLLLSKFLPLSEYAYFTVAVLAASGVTVISVPISGALMPRMVTLNAEGDEENLIRLYRNATQMTAVMVLPAMLVLALFSEQVLWAWTGDAEMARKAAPILMLYALGNGVLALSAFPYYLQFAKGDLKLHLIGSVLFVAILIPSLTVATYRYGAIGAGYAWLGTNVSYFLVWVPTVHRRFVSGLHRLWLLHDVCGIAVVAGLCAVLAHLLLKWPVDRVPAAMLLVSLGIGLLIIASITSSWVRETIVGRWQTRVY